MTEEKTRGRIIRNRARWSESGEKCNKYFRRPFEKRLQQKSHKKIGLGRWSSCSDSLPLENAISHGNQAHTDEPTVTQLLTDGNVSAEICSTNVC